MLTMSATLPAHYIGDTSARASALKPLHLQHMHPKMRIGVGALKPLNFSSKIMQNRTSVDIETP